jgi:hypothetical protein
MNLNDYRVARFQATVETKEELIKVIKGLV